MWRGGESRSRAGFRGSLSARARPAPCKTESTKGTPLRRSSLPAPFSGRRERRPPGRLQIPAPMGFLWFLGAGLFLLPGLSAGPSSSHTLHYFDSAIWGHGWETPLFTSLRYVDNQLISYYARDARHCVPQSSWAEEIIRTDADFWAKTSRRGYAISSIQDLMNRKDLFEPSGGTHTLQLFSGCELSGDGGTTRGFVEFGYNGRDFLSLDPVTLTWRAMCAEAEPIKREWDAERGRKGFWERFLKESCVERLQKYLHYGKEALQRIDPPKVRVARKVGLEGLESLVCHLYGFYPKEIDVTWRKGGEVWHQDIFHGGVLPNSDGTYHTWLNISVDPQERNRYRCHVEHDSLPEPLDVAWSASASKVGVALGVVATLFLLWVPFYFA